MLYFSTNPQLNLPHSNDYFHNYDHQWGKVMAVDTNMHEQGYQEFFLYFTCMSECFSCLNVFIWNFSRGSFVLLKNANTL